MAGMSLEEAEAKRLEMAQKVGELGDANKDVEGGNMDGLEEISKVAEDVRKIAEELHEFTHQ
jgi:hypothetical protein